MAVSDATAFLVHEGTVFYTRADVVPTPEKPYTPLTALIEGIWNHDPDFANKILRNHLCSFYLRTPLCDGMIKVAAKRARILTEFESYDLNDTVGDKKWVEIFPQLKLNLGEFESQIGKTLTPDEALDLVATLALKSELRETRSESDRQVGAVLLSKNNKLLSVAWNTNAKQRIHHCEVNLIRNYLLREKKLIPADSTLIVSLKPCAMCAAQLMTFCEDFQSLRVLYLEDDPGPAAANSVLLAGSDLAKKAKINHHKNFLIRRARIEDARAIHDVHMRSIQEVCSKLHSAEEVKAWGGREFDSEKRLRHISEQWVWVLENQKKIHGYAQINPTTDEAGTGYFAALYFDQVGAGTGFGKFMVSIMLAEARKAGLRKLTLYSTLTAHSFYLRAGFKDTGPMTTLMINGEAIRSFPMEIDL